MILLAYSCYCSTPAIHPKNWKCVNAQVDSMWYISYRFYDPFVVDDSGKVKPKQVIIKGMNSFSELKEKQGATKKLFDNELYLLKDCHYNPFTGHYSPPPIDRPAYEIDPTTPFLEALEKAWEKVKVEPATKIDIKCILKYFAKSCRQLRYQNIPISEIRRKHIVYALENCANLYIDIKGKETNVKKVWNANQFNHFRKYLITLFDKLEELEAVEYNPVTKIKIQKHVGGERETLSDSEEQKVNKHLLAVDYPYWRFVVVFFHSGARLIELLKVTREDVRLNDQEFTVTRKKGRSFQRVTCIIKDSALPLWRELYEQAEAGKYIFGKMLRAGPVSATRDFVTKRWHKYVKVGLGIEKDLYALKHKNLDETAEELDINDAAEMAGHSTPVITLTHYATKQRKKLKAEQKKRLKEVKNSFG